MDDRLLENLLRMALEVEDLEIRACEQIVGAARIAPPSAEPLSGPRLRTPGVRWTRRLAAVPIAAAASLALLLWYNSPPTTSSAAIQMQVEHCPGLPLPDGVRMERFQPSSPEHCVVLALFRTYRDECRCLAWRVHEWEDGRPLAELDPQQVLDIVLDVTDAPPIEQLLVVAAARVPADLPSDSEEASELLQCLDEQVPPTECRSDAASYATAVRACLGDRVTVVPQSLLVE
jgi:hypothetical protein